MGLDLLIPFGILLVLVLYLIYTRSKFEKDIVNLYEKKFEEWKENTDFNTTKEEKVCKELVGLIYKEGYKLNIELINENVKENIEKGKFKINKIKG